MCFYVLFVGRGLPYEVFDVVFPTPFDRRPTWELRSLCFLHGLDALPALSDTNQPVVGFAGVFLRVDRYYCPSKDGWYGPLGLLRISSLRRLVFRVFDYFS